MTDFTGKKIALISLGCDKNRVDSEKLLSDIKRRGLTLTDDLSDAEIIVINTCAFLNAARQEAIDTVLECAAYKVGKAEKIVVTGCLPQKYIGELFPALTEADVFLGTKDYDKFFEALEASYEKDRVNYVGLGCMDYSTDRYLTTPAHYAYLKIADGCSNHCTYCLIPKIRGKFISYPMDSLLKEAREIGDIAELILVAQDITRYGTDTDGKSHLAELIHKLSALENIKKIRLLYCYPDMIGDDLIEEIKTNQKVLHYIDIPLQHSEDRILKLMNRKGSRTEYLALIDKLRKNIPDIAIRSTFIAGFPSETDEEAEGLCKFLKEAKLTNCGFFAYSKEEDTPAYKLPGQIKQSVKQKRVKKLYDVQKAVSKEHLSSYVGKKLEVLCDGIDYGKNCFFGRAYFSAPDIDGLVYFNGDLCKQGETYNIYIVKSNNYDLYGHLED